MRLEIRSLQKESGITAIYVTHSQDEALAIADVVGVMKDGRIEQIAPPEEIYARPRNRFVAGFVGLANVLTAKIESAAGSRLRIVLENGSRGWCQTHSEAQRHRAGSSVSLAIRPPRIRIQRGAVPDLLPAADDHFRLSGTVRSVIFGGTLVDYFVEVAGLSTGIRVQSLSPAVAGQGEEVVLSVAPADSIVLDD
jgi:iron(III) transport system ATP-binding protein